MMKYLMLGLQVLKYNSNGRFFSFLAKYYLLGKSTLARPCPWCTLVSAKLEGSMSSYIAASAREHIAPCRQAQQSFSEEIVRRFIIFAVTIPLLFISLQLNFFSVNLSLCMNMHIDVHLPLF
jgi:hypothetical protein